MHHQNPVTLKPNQKTVLVVDDEEGILRSLQMKLRRLKYNVLTAQNRKQAMNQLYNHEVNVIMSDEKMGSESGAEMLSVIRREFPTIPRILFSGYTDMEALQKAINHANVFKFLVKPWQDVDLTQTLQEACEQNRIMSQNQFLDLLTSVKTKAVITDLLQREFKRSQRHEREFSMVMLAVDDLEGVQELHGYTIADQMLKTVATVLADHIRESDYLGQFDEGRFMVILPESGSTGVANFMNRCLTKLQTIEIPSEEETLYPQVRSASLTVVPRQFESAQEVMQQLLDQLRR